MHDKLNTEASSFFGWTAWIGNVLGKTKFLKSCSVLVICTAVSTGREFTLR